MIVRLLEILGPVRGPLEIPLGLFLNATGFTLEAWMVLAYDLFAMAMVVVFLRYVFKVVKNFFTRDNLADTADIDALVTTNANFVKSLEAATNLEATVGPLKRAKNWGQLAEVYAALNKPKDAAKWYFKAKDPKRAAEQLAKAGQTVKAAKVLAKIGDFETAGRFFLEKGKYAAAAKAFTRQGNLPGAAHAFGRAKKYQEAFRLYAEYFQAPPDSKASQATAADECHALLLGEEASEKISEEERKQLLPALARVFEGEERHELAAGLFKEGGDLVRAGEVYLLAGMLQQAAQCMKDAGKPKEAARIGGRYYESIKRWPEAAMAYTGAEEYLKAGECFAKAKELARSAECFVKAEAYYQAGLAFAHAARFEDAVSVLQKLPEDDKDFGASRDLLGRCFYEIHDYAHCAATLENHLMGKKVDKGNMEYFYMLALAHEQLGNLKQSRDLLYKIGAVQKEFRDVSNRISSIDSRISMMDSSAPIPAGGSAGGGADAKIMGMVENTLGSRYEFERELGRGGMGVVYLARDKQLDRLVALKFLGALVDTSDEYRQRFVREARTAAKITHPNIVSIYDISASEGKAYIAMEYVEGPALRGYLDGKGKLAIREALNIATQACNALEAIHGAGIVHRDVKPDNILLAKGGLVKVMDFGLAKSEDARMTKSGIVMGTPCYMSPEQALGKDVDGRTDIYAMGLVLHEMLTGKVVFEDGNVLERQVKEVPPKPSDSVEGIPEALDALVMKCLAKNPEERFAATGELVAELRKIPTA